MLNIPSYTVKQQFCFDRAMSGRRSLQCTTERCTVLLHRTIEH